MRFLTVVLLLVFSSLTISETQGQILRFLRRNTQGSTGSGYSETSNGYIYQGKEYIRGVHLPPNPNCPCPMCVDLVSAYYEARKPKVAGQPVAPPIRESASTKLIGTPEDAVPSVVKVFEKDFKENPNFVLCDPGCGDARLLIYAVKTYGVKGLGIEINPETHKIALQKVKEAGLEDRIEIKLGDSRDFKFDKVDGVVMFLFPDLISDLTKKFDTLKSGTKVVSYSHTIPLEGTVNSESIYVWRKE
jgi:hypothetical protein